jgi:DNA-binding MarR family transcriptional regulator
MRRRSSAIQREIKQRLPIGSAREEAFLGLLRTAAVVRRPVSKLVEGYGISSAQYNVLRILRGAGDAGLPTLSIRERMIEEAAGITRLIDKLQTAGLVVRSRPSTADRRKVICRVTSNGLKLLRDLDSLVRLAVEGSLSSLSEPELRRLIELLDKTRRRSTGGPESRVKR